MASNCLLYISFSTSSFLLSEDSKACIKYHRQKNYGKKEKNYPLNGCPGNEIKQKFSLNNLSFRNTVYFAFFV